MSLEIRHRRAPPRDERTDAGEREQQESERNVHRVEEWRTDGDLRLAGPFGEDREDRSPQHGKRDPAQHQVVIEERRLSAHHALELGLCLEIVEPRADQVDRDAGRHQEERSEPWSDRRLRERVHTLDHAAARDERPERREQEAHHDEHDVPLAQHPALFLNHDRMQERGRRQPRQERRVLHRIPSPVAAPAELDVRPPHSEHDADREEEPGDERPSSHDGKPLVVELAGEQRRDGKRERNGRRDVTQIQIGRMERHSRILKLRIHPATVDRREIEARERIRLDAGRQHEEDENRRDGPCRPRNELAVFRPTARNGNRPIKGKDQRPEEHRSRLPAPERREDIDVRHVRADVARDILEREVARQERGP